MTSKQLGAGHMCNLVTIDVTARDVQLLISKVNEKLFSFSRVQGHVVVV